jgi:biopolymer transport protein ExbD
MGTIGKSGEINVTPMIDVLLVLIIIFMLITPVTPKGLNANVPQPSPKDDRAQPANDIVVTVCANDSVRLNQESVAPADLQARLAALYKSSPSRVLFVRAEGNLEYQQMARVIDLARGAGLERVALMPH